MLPHITFSQDADTDSLMSVLDHLRDYVFDFMLIDGTVHSGTFAGTIGNDFLVTIMAESSPTGEVRRVDPERVVEIQYL
jgi:hypothetical protein